jgi:hypothetical protein
MYGKLDLKLLQRDHYTLSKFPKRKVENVSPPVGHDSSRTYRRHSGAANLKAERMKALLANKKKLGLEGYDPDVSGILKLDSYALRRVVMTRDGNLKGLILQKSKLFIHNS